MKDVYKELLGESHDVDARLLQKFLKSFEQPKIKEDKEFKKHLAKKLSKAIEQKKSEEQEHVIATVPSFVKWRYRLTGFVTAMCAFLFVFILSFFSDFFSEQIHVPAKYQYLEDQAFEAAVLGKMRETEETEGMVGIENMAMDSAFALKSMSDSSSFLMNATEQSLPEQEYRFLYDGKKYPKIASSLSVYKRGGALVNNALISKSLSALKIGDISLKKFPEMMFSQMQLTSKLDTEYQISMDLDAGTFSIRDYQQKEPLYTEIPSEKEIKKRIEKKLKGLGISLQNYGSLELVVSPYPESEGIYTVFYPFLINGSFVYDYVNIWNNKPLGINGSYNVFTDQLSLSNIDVAQYEVSNYPSISKEELMDKIITGGDFFDGGSRSEYALGIKTSAPEMVYLLQNEYYIPALKFTVDVSHYPVEENTSVLYVKLVDF